MIKFFLILSLAPLSLWSAVYNVTGKSKIGFDIVKFKIGGTVEGQFKEFTGKIEMDGNTLKRLEGNVEVAAIDTESEKRDDHLRSPDFFDVKKHPKMTFVSTESVKLEKGAAIRIPGTLTVKGVSKPVTLAGRVSELSDTMVRLNLASEINRTDFGVTWNKALEEGEFKTVGGILGKFVLADEVTIKLQLNASK